MELSNALRHCATLHFTALHSLQSLTEIFLSQVRRQLATPLKPAWEQSKAVIEHFADLALAEEVHVL